jgi:hypothetical protein
MSLKACNGVAILAGAKSVRVRYFYRYLDGGDGKQERIDL